MSGSSCARSVPRAISHRRRCTSSRIGGAAGWRCGRRRRPPSAAPTSSTGWRAARSRCVSPTSGPCSATTARRRVATGSSGSSASSCIGDGSPAADVEVIELQQTLYRELGLGDLTLRINSIGTAESRRRYEEALRAHLEPHAATLTEDSRRRLVTNVLRVLDSKDDAGNPAVQSAPSITDALGPGDRAHFAEVRRLLEALDIDHEIDPRIVRGLDYYAHTVWEFEPPGGGGQSTVGAGGRYDGLIELLGGPPTPGTGFATGVERIIRTLREQGIEEPCAPAPDVVMVAIGEAGAAWAMRVAAALRRAGFVVRGATPVRSLRAQLRTAGHLDARYAVIAGEREAATAVVQLKPLSATGEERTLDIEGVIDALGGAIGPQPPAQSAGARAAEASDA